MNTKRLTARVAQHEGLRLKPYRCSEGYITGGYGRNLEARGVSLEEAQLMLQNDLKQSCTVAQAIAGERLWRGLSPMRQETVAEMCFQLGSGGLAGFKKMWAALRTRRWAEAAAEMRDSKWAKQTPARAEKLAAMMEKG